MLLATSLTAVQARAEPPHTSIEEEPERLDSEYYLDMLTFRPDRFWRSLWLERDNAYTLRFGSLNVEQWALVQSLKFAAPVSGRVRIRYHLEMHELLDERSADRSELETEVRIEDDYYVSALLAPAFWKRENDIGLRLQRRTAIDRFALIDLRVIDAANDFAYTHGEDIEGEERIYSSQPFEIGIEAVEQIAPGLRFGLEASAVTLWRRDNSFEDDPSRDYSDAGRSRELELWTEYDPAERWSFDLDLRVAEYIYERSGPATFTERHRVRSFLPRVWYLSGSRPQGRPRWILSAGIQVRRERWSREGDEAGSFRKDELLPLLTGELALSPSHSVSAGYLADFYDAVRTGAGAGSDDRSENRIRLAWIYRVGGRGRLEVVETLDLDSEDHGQFSIHDHFFVMLLLGF